MRPHSLLQNNWLRLFAAALVLFGCRRASFGSDPAEPTAPPAKNYSAQEITAATHLRSVGIAGAELEAVLGRLKAITAIARQGSPATYSDLLMWTRLYVDIQRAGRVPLEYVNLLKQHGIDIVPQMRSETKMDSVAFAEWLHAGHVSHKHFNAALRKITAPGGRYYIQKKRDDVAGAESVSPTSEQATRRKKSN